MAGKQLAVSALKGGLGQANGIPTGIRWPDADLDSENGRKEVAAVISSYFKNLRSANDSRGFTGSDKYGIKYTRPGHLPGGLPAKEEVDIRFYGPWMDLGIFSIFRHIDKRGSKNPTFKYANVSAQAIIFEQKRDGQEVKLRKVSGGAASSLESVTWEGALGIDDEAKRFDEYSIFEQNVQTVPDMYSDRQATALATLVTALGAGINETFATDVITTLNNACAQIVEDIGEAYGLTDNPGFVLLHNHRQASVVKKALMSDLTLANDNNSATELNFDITPVSTRKIPTGSMYLCIPGYDAVLVEWDELFAEFGRDWARGVDAHIYRGRWNAGIGNTGQFRRIPLA